MKRRTIALLLAAGVLAGSAAHAAPLNITGDGPLFIKFSNREQISPTGGILSPDGNFESSWGILNVDTVREGVVNEAPSVSTTGEIGPAATTDPLFTAGGFSGGQITGIFYGLEAESFNATTGILNSTGGFLDLYWDELGFAGGGTAADLNAALPSSRTADNQYDDFTDGELLVRLAFDTGILNNDTTTVTGSNTGTGTIDGTGVAEGFFSVADLDGDGVIDADDGLWAVALDSDFFNVDTDGDGVFGEEGERRDLRFKNSFNNLDDWDGTAADGETPVIGASSDDPVQAFAVPEPSSVGLLGLGLLALGLGGSLRRRRV